MPPTPANNCALGANDPLSTVALITTRAGDAASKNEIADSTACKTSLLDLAAELQASIAEVLDSETLLSFRQVSRELEMNSNDAFLDRFFKKRRHLLTMQSMQVLVEISATPTFARHIQEIELMNFHIDRAFTHGKEISDWCCDEEVWSDKNSPVLFHDMLRSLARLGSSPVIKVNSFDERSLNLDDNIFHRNHIKDGHRRESESIYGLQNLRARARPLWALTGVQEALRLKSHHVTGVAQDFVLALADYPQVVRHLELGTNACSTTNSIVNLNRLARTHPAKLRLACANITTLQIGVHVSFWTATDLRLANHQTSVGLHLLHAAVNVTTLDISLRPSCDMRVIWAEVAHLNLRSMGFGECLGSYQALTEVLSQHQSTLEDLRLDKVRFSDAPSGPVRLLSWMGENLNLKQLSVYRCYALGAERGEHRFLLNGQDESSFVLVSDEHGTVSDKLKDVESWAYFQSSSEPFL